MNEVLPKAPLHIVKSIEAEVPPPIHPSLENAAMFITLQLAGETAVGDFYDATHSVTFSRAFDAEQLLGFLSQPISAHVEGHKGIDIRHGLRSLTYQNSREMRNAKYLEPHAREKLLQLRPQIDGLLKVIDHPRHHEMVPAKIHVYDELLADLATRDTLPDMKPSELGALCEAHGITFDQLKMWRMKGGDRHNRHVKLDKFDTFGLDPNELVPKIIADTFRAKTVIPGETPALIPVNDLPNVPWAHEAGYIELVRRLPALNSEEVGQRWEALLRKEGTPRHVVFPRVTWRTDTIEHRRSWIDKTAEYHRISYAWRQPFKHLVYDYVEPVYSPASHTIVHTSSLLGAAMLAATAEPDVFRHELRDLYQGAHASQWDHTPLPRKAAGAFVALLQSPYVMTKIMDSVGFKNLEKTLRV